ncbi:MAG TPA: hypothetical protein VNM46_03790 [Xanthobacteraceae bacterium]|nr:hypothetical protein [Xanthobacteraceae bacterium]
MRPAFAIAPDFHLSGGWSDRLLLAEGEGWRSPREDELAALMGESSEAESAVLLFTVPAHMRGRFWEMLGEEAAEGTGDFVTFAADLRQFLAFKELPPPADALFDLVVQDVGGAVDTAGLWALVNFGDEPLVLDWPDVRLRLGSGEGCRTSTELPAVAPPADDPNVMVAIRREAPGVDRPKLDS